MKRRPSRAARCARSYRLVALAEPLEPRIVLSTYTVTNINDSGPGSLRQAIVDASASSSADAITFDTSGVFAIPQTISLLTALPDIPASGGGLTILGPGAPGLIIRRNPGALTFRILNSSAPTLAISGVTISNGSDTSGLGGGGLAVGGTSPNVTLDSVIFTQNSSNDSGGAIYFSTPGFLTLRNSTLSNNTAGVSGGGIYFFAGGSMLIDSSSLFGNVANGVAAGEGGGGVYFFGVADPMAPIAVDPGSIAIRASTLNNNISSGIGGAVDLRFFTGKLEVQNSTIAANTAATSGGAIALSGGSGSISLESSTIFGNTANGTAAGTGGGGLARITSSAGSIDVLNSVVSGDTNANGPDIFRSGAATTVNVNFSAVGSNIGFVLSGGNNVAFGTNLLLGPLSNNGGPTQTMLPQILSPLIEAGSKDAMINRFANDQRGPGFQRITDAEVDIGAVEQQSKTIIVTNINDSGAGSFRDAMTQALANPASDTITFDPTFFSVPRLISLLSVLPSPGGATGGLTITGPGPNLLSLFAAGSARLFSVQIPFLTVSGLNLAGGINSSGQLAVTTLTNVSMSGGSQSTGGSIFIGNSGCLHLDTCVIDNNTGTTSGGGVFFNSGGSLLIENTTFLANNNNGSGGGGALAFNGAINATPPPGFSDQDLVIRNSSFLSNSSAGSGGAINMTTFTGNLLLQNDTIVGNTALGSGGGVVVTSGSGSITAVNCTISGNSASATAANTGGGGIARISSTAGTITLANTVVAFNNNTPGPDVRAIAGTTTNVNYCEVRMSTGFTYSMTSDHNITNGADPNLASSAANIGGPTSTLSFLNGSVLRNAGSNDLAASLATDQRGNGYARISDGTVDIGAYEQQPYIVTNANDSGTGSLRDILTDTINNIAADEITFDVAGAFATPQTITLESALPGLANTGSGLTITGTGSSRLTLRRDPAAPPFGILSASNGSLALTGLTISGGNASGGTGGAVTMPSGTLTTDDTSFVGNSATNSGGAVYAGGNAFVMIRNSTLSGNTAGSSGGGLYVGTNSLLVIDSTAISGNTTSAAFSGGGGFYFSGQTNASTPTGFTAGTLVIRNSTFGNNTAGAAGGGIELASLAGTLLLQNTTLNGNMAADSGGGVALGSGNGTITLQNVTISGNTSGAVAPGSGGGGVARTSSNAGVINISNSVVSGNVNANAPDILGVTGITTTNVNFSAIGSLTGFILSGTSANNLSFGTALGLGPLADNGGQTFTMMPSPGSPLLNAGSNGLSPAGFSFDQRGPGYPRIQTSTVDIGAVERPVAAPVVSQAVYDFSVSPNQLRFTFSEVVQSSLTLGNLQVVRQGAGPVAGITYTSYDTVNSVATFTLPVSLPNGNYHATIFAAGISSPAGPMPADFSFDFFVLAGDANRDRIVNVGDLTILALNWQQSARDYRHANFSYDPAGMVDINDLMIMMNNWQQTPEGPVAGPAIPAVAGVTSPPPSPAPTRVARRTATLATDVVG